MTTAGRHALFDRFTGKPKAFRPPWAESETRFAALCSGCGDCIRGCPEGILVAGRGGLPQIDFSLGGCSFCGHCAEACRDGAFRRREDGDPWSLKARIGEHCVERQGIACRLCESWCDEAAIRFRPLPGGKSEARVDSDLCSGCGACVKSCPSSAIEILPQVASSQTKSMELRV